MCNQEALGRALPLAGLPVDESLTGLFGPTRFASLLGDTRSLGTHMLSTPLQAAKEQTWEAAARSLDCPLPKCSAACRLEQQTQECALLEDTLGHGPMIQSDHLRRSLWAFLTGVLETTTRFSKSQKCLSSLSATGSREGTGNPHAPSKKQSSPQFHPEHSRLRTSSP